MRHTMNTMRNQSSDVDRIVNPEKLKRVQAPSDRRHGRWLIERAQQVQGTYRKSYAKGSALFYEGDEAVSVFSITSGAVRLSTLCRDGKRQVIGFLMSGEFIGFLDRETYPWTCEALSGVTVCCFSRETLSEMICKFPKVEHRLLEVAWANVASGLEQIRILGKRTALEKVCCFLLMLAERKPSFSNDEQLLALPMPRADIADFLGLAHETISRCFTRLEAEGLIVIEHPNLVRINDPIALASCCDYL
jgi:CRP/FNR family transcriptional regulator, anaerobic regulatory protein